MDVMRDRAPDNEGAVENLRYIPEAMAKIQLDTNVLSEWHEGPVPLPPDPTPQPEQATESIEQDTTANAIEVQNVAEAPVIVFNCGPGSGPSRSVGKPPGAQLTDGKEPKAINIEAQVKKNETSEVAEPNSITKKIDSDVLEDNRTADYAPCGVAGPILDGCNIRHGTEETPTKEIPDCAACELPGPLSEGTTVEEDKDKTPTTEGSNCEANELARKIFEGTNLLEYNEETSEVGGPILDGCNIRHGTKETPIKEIPDCAACKLAGPLSEGTNIVEDKDKTPTTEASDCEANELARKIFEGTNLFEDNEQTPTAEAPDCAAFETTSPKTKNTSKLNKNLAYSYKEPCPPGCAACKFTEENCSSNIANSTKQMVRYLYRYLELQGRCTNTEDGEPDPRKGLSVFDPTLNRPIQVDPILAGRSRSLTPPLNIRDDSSNSSEDSNCGVDLIDTIITRLYFINVDNEKRPEVVPPQPPGTSRPLVDPEEPACSASQSKTSDRPESRRQIPIRPVPLRPGFLPQMAQYPVSQQLGFSRPGSHRQCQPLPQRPTPQRPTPQRPTPQRPTSQRPTSQRPTSQRPTSQRPTPQGLTPYQCFIKPFCTAPPPSSSRNGNRHSQQAVAAAALNPAPHEVRTYFGSDSDEECMPAPVHLCTITKVDMTPLNKYAAESDHPNKWYIVADSRTLLADFGFLSVMLDSDKTCHLLIPQRTLTQLHGHVKRSKNKYDKRLLLQINHQIRIGFLLLAPDSKRSKEYTNAVVTLTTCLELMKDNYHVILICQEKELLEHKSTTLANMFTVQEIKQLLHCPKPDQQCMVLFKAEKFKKFRRKKILADSEIFEKVARLKNIRSSNKVQITLPESLHQLDITKNGQSQIEESINECLSFIDRVQETSCVTNDDTNMSSNNNASRCTINSPNLELNSSNNYSESSSGCEIISPTRYNKSKVIPNTVKTNGKESKSLNAEWTSSQPGSTLKVEVINQSTESKNIKPVLELKLTTNPEKNESKAFKHQDKKVMIPDIIEVTKSDVEAQVIEADKVSQPLTTNAGSQTCDMSHKLHLMIMTEEEIERTAKICKYGLIRYRNGRVKKYITRKTLKAAIQKCINEIMRRHWRGALETEELITAVFKFTEEFDGTANSGMDLQTRERLKLSLDVLLQDDFELRLKYNNGARCRRCLPPKRLNKNFVYLYKQKQYKFINYDNECLISEELRKLLQPVLDEADLFLPTKLDTRTLTRLGFILKQLRNCLSEEIKCLRRLKQYQLVKFQAKDYFSNEVSIATMLSLITEIPGKIVARAVGKLYNTPEISEEERAVAVKRIVVAAKSVVNVKRNRIVKKTKNERKSSSFFGDGLVDFSTRIRMFNTLDRQLQRLIGQCFAERVDNIESLLKPCYEANHFEFLHEPYNNVKVFQEFQRRLEFTFLLVHKLNENSAQGIGQKTGTDVTVHLMPTRMAYYVLIASGLVEMVVDIMKDRSAATCKSKINPVSDRMLTKYCDEWIKNFINVYNYVQKPTVNEKECLDTDAKSFSEYTGIKVPEVKILHEHVRLMAMKFNNPLIRYALRRLSNLFYIHQENQGALSKHEKIYSAYVSGYSTFVVEILKRLKVNQKDMDIAEQWLMTTIKQYPVLIYVITLRQLVEVLKKDTSSLALVTKALEVAASVHRTPEEGPHTDQVEQENALQNLDLIANRGQTPQSKKKKRNKKKRNQRFPLFLLKEHNGANEDHQNTEADGSSNEPKSAEEPGSSTDQQAKESSATDNNTNSATESATAETQATTAEAQAPSASTSANKDQEQPCTSGKTKDKTRRSYGEFAYIETPSYSKKMSKPKSTKLSKPVSSKPAKKKTTKQKKSNVQPIQKPPPKQANSQKQANLPNQANSSKQANSGITSRMEKYFAPKIVEAKPKAPRASVSNTKQVADKTPIKYDTSPKTQQSGKSKQNKPAATSDTSVATTSAASVASTSATSVASTSATSVASTSATSVASTSATSVASTSATSVAFTSATSVASTSATSVASTTATSVASTTATSVASTSATSVATTSATSIASTSATSVASTSATSVASTIATSVASTSATSVASTSATSVASTSATSVTTTSAASAATTVTTDNVEPKSNTTDSTTTSTSSDDSIMQSFQFLLDCYLKDYREKLEDIAIFCFETNRELAAGPLAPERVAELIEEGEIVYDELLQTSEDINRAAAEDSEVGEIIGQSGALDFGMDWAKIHCESSEDYWEMVLCCRKQISMLEKDLINIMSKLKN